MIQLDALDLIKSQIRIRSILAQIRNQGSSIQWLQIISVPVLFNRIHLMDVLVEFGFVFWNESGSSFLFGSDSS